MPRITFPESLTTSLTSAAFTLYGARLAANLELFEGAPFRMHLQSALYSGFVTYCCQEDEFKLLFIYSTSFVFALLSFTPQFFLSLPLGHLSLGTLNYLCEQRYQEFSNRGLLTNSNFRSDFLVGLLFEALIPAFIAGNYNGLIRAKFFNPDYYLKALTGSILIVPVFNFAIYLPLPFEHRYENPIFYAKFLFNFVLALVLGPYLSSFLFGLEKDQQVYDDSLVLSLWLMILGLITTLALKTPRISNTAAFILDNYLASHNINPERRSEDRINLFIIDNSLILDKIYSLPIKPCQGLKPKEVKAYEAYLASRGSHKEKQDFKAHRENKCTLTNTEADDIENALSLVDKNSAKIEIDRPFDRPTFVHWIQDCSSKRKQAYEPQTRIVIDPQEQNFKIVAGLSEIRLAYLSEVRRKLNYYGRLFGAAKPKQPAPSAQRPLTSQRRLP